MELEEVNYEKARQCIEWLIERWTDESDTTGLNYNAKCFRVILNELDNRNGLLEDTKINVYLKGRKDESIAWKTKIEEKKDWYQETMKYLCKNGIDLDKYERYEEVVNFCEKLLNKE